LARPSLAFATTSPTPLGDDDRPLLDQAAARLGVDAQWVPWRDPHVDWSAFDVVLIRSTWDYHEAREEFVLWAERVDAVTRLHNPAPIVAWNSHKGYLVDLEKWSVPIVPTTLVRPSSPESVAAVADRHGWSDVVIKPSVGAGALGAGRWRADEPAAERALAAILESGDALVQPYLREIESGETSVLVLDGDVTHAVAKVPASGDFRVQLHHGGVERAVEPTPSEVELAGLALAAASRVAPILYARVDCVTVDGQARLMELEVLEPALYLSFAPESAADRLLAAILRTA
jgi:glutathione synthase/RimK-type ligase-like ATP-grasp enzyme